MVTMVSTNSKLMANCMHGYYDSAKTELMANCMVTVVSAKSELMAHFMHDYYGFSQDWIDGYECYRYRGK